MYVLSFVSEINVMFCFRLYDPNQNNYTLDLVVGTNVLLLRLCFPEKYIFGLGLYDRRQNNAYIRDYGPDRCIIV
jgi:hypothetical protein